MPTVAVILAGGLDPRLQSNLPDALHPVLGDPALLWMLRALPAGVAAAVVVAGAPVATALAAWTAQELLPCAVAPVGGEDGVDAELERLGADRVLLLPALMPLLEAGTLSRLAAAADACRLGASRVCVLPRAQLRGDLSAGDLPHAVLACEQAELASFTSRQELADLQELARRRVNQGWMEQGVSFLQPGTSTVGPRVELARDVLVEAQTVLEGRVRVGEGTRIGQGCVIRDSEIGPEVELKPYCVVQRSSIGRGAQVGPFAHLREGSQLEEGVHMGNFVETKKALLHAGAKASHLSYLGDAEVGERTNIGAGFISCNYDGFSKHRTVIGRDVFVGSDCQLVAPVTLGDGSLIGAGSTITEDIPAGALALTRAPLVVKEGAAERLREKLRAKRKSG